MKTLLIPVDLTATTENAVNFGAEWSNQYQYTRIILLKTFYNSIFDPIVMAAEYAPVSQEFRLQERTEAMEQLEALQLRLTSLVNPGITIEIIISEAPVLRAVMDAIKTEQPEMVLLGSNNYQQSTGSIIAENVVSIAKTSPVRVLIVPAGYTYKPVREVLIPVDFNALHHLDKLVHIRSNPAWQNVQLRVLNVDPSETYLNPDDTFRATEAQLHNYLRDFKHELYYSNTPNIIDGVMNFTRENELQLIIALPGKHSFLYSLTHKSISEAIYRNAQEPVMLLK